jgi:RNA 2',3'-cyclic 3'-phosphodiesterase
VDTSRLHVTLLFLGLLDAAQAAAARTAASSVRGAPFDLVLDRAGGFPRARVWWLGCATRPAALMALWLELSAAMDAAAVAYDRRPLAPHVTFQRGVLRMLPMHDRPPLVWPVREFTLVRSTLPPASSAYDVVARWALS